jgi:AsmA protein
MGKLTRIVLAAAGILILLVVLVIIALPMFLNADSFRTRIEADLTKSLGRPVTMSKLSLSIWSGGLLAENVQIADDPSFSTQPFLEASSVKISVELMPLIFSKQVHIQGFTVVDPKVDLLRAANGKWNYSTLGTANKPATPAGGSNESLSKLTAGNIYISNGTVTVGDQGATQAQAVQYQKVNLDLSKFGAGQTSPFTLSAALPDQGTVSAKGTVGPINESDTADTPLHADATLKGVHLASSGVLPPDAGIQGIMDMQAQIQSNGRSLQADGTAQVSGLELSRDASPAPQPLHVQFTIAKDEQANQGQIQHAVVSSGGVSLNIAGTFTSHGTSTDLNLKVDGNAMPIDSIEAFLPALGVHLPAGSQLRGGTLTTSLAVTGATASPALAGPVRLDSTQLAGFDLDAKLGPLAKLTGGKVGAATGSGTNIKLLTMNVQESGNNIRTDNVDLELAGIGTATGNGTVSAGGDLHYTMLLKLTGLSGSAQPAAAPARSPGGLGALAGLVGGAGSSVLGGTAGALFSHGIPVEITGTTSHPTITPNLGGLTKGIGAGALQQLAPGASTEKKSSNPLKNPLGGLLPH